MPEYQLNTCVWEVTMACNMRCGHCGSQCEKALSDELTTDEAIQVLDSLKQLNTGRIVFSGGEALLRKDIFYLFEESKKRKIPAYLISNGWNIDKNTALKLKSSGIISVTISVDGTELIHDKLRKKDSYNHIIQAFKNLSEVGVIYDVITTVNKKNIDYLFELAKELEQHNVCYWQIQLVIPMGNASDDMDLILDYQDVQKVIDICDSLSKTSKLKITLGDNVGYYDKRITDIFTRSYGQLCGIWHKCTAGIHTMGLRHNGDVVGCLSIRDNIFIEGNIRNKRLEKIWNDEKSFQWNRKFDANKLDGYCSQCNYKEHCNGGCTCMRYFSGGSIYAENKYCSYNVEMNK